MSCARDADWGNERARVAVRGVMNCFMGATRLTYLANNPVWGNVAACRTPILRDELRLLDGAKERIDEKAARVSFMGDCTADQKLPDRTVCEPGLPTGSAHSHPQT